MADIATTNQAAAVGGGMVGQQKTKQGTAGSDGIVIDKNKSQEQYITEAEAKYIIPAIVRDKFPDLVKLIYETESMNEEEREYWMQIMPIMSEEQIVKFRDILVNERDQLAKLDKEYNQEMSRIDNKAPVVPIDETKRKESIEKIKQAEAVQQTQEKSEEDALLGQLKQL
ncbi:hypothetical protein HZA40_04460 [Candidatus Peregrinibacteria bacterium]|nr:hypothetical protein [Candidatus Peregrinibacteria bacterium]